MEKDKFEMWVNGSLVAKEKGGQFHAHGDDIGVGYVNQNAVFHDEKGSAGQTWIILRVWSMKLAFMVKRSFPPFKI